MTQESGSIDSISGPVVKCGGLRSVRMYEVVRVGHEKLIGEVIEVGDNTCIVQVYEEIYFVTSDGKRLNGWFIPNKEATFTIIFCHGNAGNISHRIDKISILYNLGVNIFIFDYRGYGKSQGKPSESGFYKDAKSAYKYLVEERKISAEDIILYGESIGSCVAINLAGEVKVRALITEEAFTSIKDMAKIAYPFLPHFIFSSRFNSIPKLRDIDCQKLIIHSLDDEIVPFYLGEKLFNKASPPKKFLNIRGAIL